MQWTFCYCGVALDPPALSLDEARERARAVDPEAVADHEARLKVAAMLCWSEARASSFWFNFKN